MVCIVSLGVAQARTDGANLRASFKQAVKIAAPSVVNIYTAKVVNAPVMDDPRARGVIIGSARERVQRSLGSGVIVKAGGIVVTNLHVIEGADAVKVVLNDGRDYVAKLIGSDEKLDLAVLKVNAPESASLPVVRFGDSDTLEVGDVVLALGNPFGIGQSASMGVVSAVARSNVALSPYGQFIQTDASINPGDSGGALVDSTGALVGINTAIFTKSGGSNGIGFAIPTALVRTVVDDITRVGRVVRPWLGAEGQAMTDSVAEELGLGETRGVLLTAIVPGSPAANAGLRTGDVIIRLAGKDVIDPVSLNDKILATPNLLDRPTSMVIWREGRMQEIQATLTALPARDTKGRLVITGYNPLNGVMVEALGPALNADLGLALSTRGVAVVDAPQKAPLAAFNFSVKPGDLILSINGNQVKTPKEVQQAVDSDRRQWEIRIQRDGKLIKALVK
jgi:Do/DeqQ family serine protease